MRFFTICLMSLVHTISQSQTFDPSFKPIFTTQAYITAMTRQADGKLLVAGNFRYSGATPIGSLVRLNADGTIDPTFLAGTFGNTLINQILVQPDGKILVGGSFLDYNASNRKGLVRLLADGSIDAAFTEFNSTSNFTSSRAGYVTGLALQADGKIIVKGEFAQVGGTSHGGIVRLHADGTVDDTFGAQISSSGGVLPLNEHVVVLPTGKILVSGMFTNMNGNTANRFLRLNADGTTDNTFNTGTAFNEVVNSLALQADGKILACGRFTSYNGSAVNKLARLNADGTLDATFPTDIGLNSGNYPEKLLIQADGKILLGGNFQSPRTRIMRLNTNGTIDNTFSIGSGPSSSTVSSIVTDGTKIFLGGTFAAYNGTRRTGFAAVDNLGALDTTIDLKFGIPASVNAVSRQPDGKLVIGGDFVYINGTAANRIARLNTNGTMDATFNAGTGCDNIVYVLQALADGKLLVGGLFSNYNGATVKSLIRLSADGVRDPTYTPDIGRFFTDQGVYHLHLYADEKVLIGGSFAHVNGANYNWLARLNTDGSTDLTLNQVALPSIVTTMSVNPSNGDIVAGSYFNWPYFKLLNANASPVSTFNFTGTISSGPRASGFAPDGHILLGGRISYQSSTHGVVKLTADGSVDPSFSFAHPGQDVNHIGRIGEKYLFNAGSVSITSSTGQVLDTSMPVSGTVMQYVHSSDGLYVAGSVQNPNDATVSGLLRFTLPPTVPADPTTLSAAIEPGKITLSWSDQSTDEIAFEVYRAVGTGPFAKIGSIGKNLTSFIDLTTDPELNYSYQVKATNLTGDSGPSNTVAVTTLPDKPKAPSNLKATEISPIEVELTWKDNSINEQEFLIYSGSLVLLATVPANTTTYRHRFLNPGAQYSYFVRAKNTLGESGNSNYVFIDLSDPTRGTWTDAGNSPSLGRFSAVAFVIGNKAYVGTGSNASGRLRDFWEYDPVAGTWTQKADFPGTARTGAMGFSLNGKGYIGTGNDGTLVDGMVRFKRDFYQYDPATNTWAAVADYPEDFTSGAGISGGTCFVAGGFAYAGLGNNGVNNPKDFYRYDPAANKWDQMADFGGAGRTGSVGFAGNGKGYIALGGVSTKLRDVWEYAIATNTWTKMFNDFSGVARTGATAFEIGDRAYVGAGDAGDLFTESNRKDFWEFNLTTRQWRSIPDFPGSSRNSAVAVVVDGKAYVGLGGSGSTYYDDFKKFDNNTDKLPDAPANLAITNASNKAQLTWTDQSADEVGFVIERSNFGPNNFQRLTTLDPDVTSYLDESVNAGSTYYYRVRAANAFGYSLYSNSASITLIPPPLGPSSLSYTTVVTGTTATITVTWNDNSTNEDGFEIFRSLHDGTNYVSVGTVTNNQFTDTALPLDSKVYYRVRSFNANGASGAINLLAFTPPHAPTNLIIQTVSTTTIEISWEDPSSTETQYQVHRNPGATIYLDPNVTTYVDNAPGPNTFYTYKIYARNDGGLSAPSNEVTAITLPTAPTGLSIRVNSSTEAQLQWTAVANATYSLERQTQSQDNAIIEPFTSLAESISSQLYKDMGLEPLIYTYRLRATNPSGSSDFAAPVTINWQVVTGLDEMGHGDPVYPNPFRDRIHIDPTFCGDIQVLDVQGREVFKAQVCGKEQLDLSPLHPGVFIMKAQSHGQVFETRLVKLQE